MVTSFYFVISLVILINNFLEGSAIELIYSHIALQIVLVILWFTAKNHHRLTFSILYILTGFIAAYIVHTTSIHNIIIPLLMLVILFTANLVLGVYLTIAITAILSVIVLFASITNSTQTHSVLDVLVIVCLNFLFLTLIRLAYAELNNAYTRSLEYSKELEKYNTQLDELVQERTAQLRKIHRETLYSLHSQAILGSIAKSLIHDISLPLSSLSGSLKLIHNQLKQSNPSIIQSSEVVKEIENGQEKLETANRIVKSSREMLSGKRIYTRFNPNQIAGKAIVTAKTHARMNGIKIITNFSSNSKIFGSPEMLERALTNIIINSIEELGRTTKTKKTIHISTEDNADDIIIKIEDNGRGIPESKIKQINSGKYQAPSGSRNLGFGLQFVRMVIKSEFSGEFAIESNAFEFTRTIISLKKSPPIPNV